MPKRVHPKVAPPILSEHLPADFVLQLPEELSRHNNFRDAKGEIKRPQNSFFIMRTEFQRQIAGTVSQSLVSKLAAALWNEMSIEKKKPWYALARKLQDEHKVAFPEYVYRPSTHSKRKGKGKRAVMVYEDDEDDEDEGVEAEEGRQLEQSNRRKMAEAQSMDTPQLMRASTARVMARPYPAPAQTRAFVGYASVPMQNGLHQGYYLPAVNGGNPMHMFPVSNPGIGGYSAAGVVPNTNYHGHAPGPAQQQNFLQHQKWYYDQLILHATHRLEMEAKWNASRMQQPQEMSQSRGYPYLGHVQNSLQGTAEQASTNPPMESSTMYPSQAGGPSNAPTKSHYRFSPTLSATSTDSCAPSTSTSMLSPISSSLTPPPATTMTTSSYDTTNYRAQTPTANSDAFNWGMAMPAQNNVLPVWPDMSMMNSNMNNLPPLPFPLRTSTDGNANMNMTRANTETNNSNSANSNYTTNHAATSSDPVIDPQLLEPPAQTQNQPQYQTEATVPDLRNVQSCSAAADVQSISHNAYQLGEALSHSTEGFPSDYLEQGYYHEPPPLPEGLSSGFFASTSQTPSNGAETQIFNGSAHQRFNCHDSVSGRELTLNDYNTILGAAWDSASGMADEDWS